MPEDGKGNATQKVAPDSSQVELLGQELDFDKLAGDDSTQKNGADFFNALDNQVNAGILNTPDELQEMERQKTSSGGEKKPSKSPVDPEQEVKNLTKRYSDSSKEAKRLAQENAKLKRKLEGVEPYMPVLEELRENKGLRDHVKTYYDSGGQTPKSIKEQLNLPEDFVYDPEDAVSDPNSDSGKVFQTTVDRVVERRLGEFKDAQQREMLKQKQAVEETEFRAKHKMSDEAWEEFVEFAKNTPMTLENIYALMTRGQREKNIEEGANRRLSNKIKETQGLPRSMANKQGAPATEKSADDVVFDFILGLDKTEKMFG